MIVPQAPMDGVRLNRVDYASDLDFFKDILQVERKWGIKKLGALPYGRIDQFRPRVTILGPHCEIARIPFTWSSEQEKYRLMDTVALLTRVTSGKAIMVCSDTRCVQFDDFREHFKLPKRENTPDGRKQDVDDYNRIMRQDYGGTMENLPRHLYREFIWTAVKSQEFGVMSEFDNYTRGSNGRVMWLPPDPIPSSKDTKGETGLIRDWWKIPDDDPNLKNMIDAAATSLEEMLRKMRGGAK